MKNNTKSILIAAAAVLAAAALTGCGQVRTAAPQTTAPQTSAEPIVQVTEKVTEAPQTESETRPQKQSETQPQKQSETQPQKQSETQPQKQSETQPQAQSETQPQTQSETQAPAQTTGLSKEEEQAQESGFTDYRTMWAMDDINVRETPTTAEGNDNIFYSLDQGQSAEVTGETPNWYVISVPYTDEAGNTQYQKGYVSKQFLSESEVQPKTDEERAAAAETAQPADTAAAADTTQQSAPAEAADTTQQEQAAPAAPVDGTPKTMAADANIRADASQTSDVVGVVSAGETVTVIGDADGWYQVDYNGVQGYVNKNLVG